MIVSMR